MKLNVKNCLLGAIALSMWGGSGLCYGQAAAPESGKVVQSISREQFIDKMKGGWLGQMVGVAWGAPTEFFCPGFIMPDKMFPEWNESMVNTTFGQDDIYVDLCFVDILERRGFDVSIREAGIEFANTGFGLDHANRYARENLRKGIAPPDSSHPALTRHSDDIDYQIEADFSGLIAPGMPNYPVEAGEKFGRIICYGDGMYGGQWVGVMYALAFFETNPETIVEKSLQYLPEKSQYRECITDVLNWYRENPDDWKATWQKINTKYHKNIDYRQYSCRLVGDFNIDAKINGAYIAMGLLYGRGNFEDTIRISTMCGQDSDCNPSSSGGILGTMLGYNALGEQYKKVDNTQKFYATPYTFEGMIEASAKLAKTLVEREGGTITQENGVEMWNIPVQPVEKSELEMSHWPKMITGACYTEAEMERIKERTDNKEPFEKIMRNIFPDWLIYHCSQQPDVGYHKELKGHENVLVTMPFTWGLPCIITRDYQVPANATNDQLHFKVEHLPGSDFQIVVRVNGEPIYDQVIGPKVSTDNVYETYIDLSPYAGQTINLSILHVAEMYYGEIAYWYNLDFRNKPETK